MIINMRPHRSSIWLSRIDTYSTYSALTVGNIIGVLNDRNRIGTEIQHPFLGPINCQKDECQKITFDLIEGCIIIT